MMENALRYASMGFPVFPVYEPVDVGVCSCAAGAADILPNGDKHPKGKHPRTEHGLSDATTDLIKVREWWTKWPNANIGLATGNGIGVVDLDGPEGINSGRQLNLSSPIVTITGRGEQLWYRIPEGEKLVTRRARKLAEGVDTRGTGGYVLVPPSLHPNGKRYCWAGSPINRNLLPVLPTLFFQEKNQLPGLRKANEASWIAEALQEMRQGHVHNTLVRVLGKFRSHNFSEEDTFKLLEPHALVDGKPYEPLRAKIAEIWKRYPLTNNVTAAKSEDIETFLQDMETPEWICEPFVARKLIGFVAGLPETLKTWLCADLAVECARGDGMWLGLFPTKNCKVLFIDQERWKGETQRRFSAILAAKDIPFSQIKNSLVMKSGTTIRLNLDSSYQAFRTELMEMKPDLVIVDSFVAFHTVPENDKAEIQKVLERVKTLRTEVGCTFLFIHHENKNAYPNGEPQGEPNMSTLSGSTGIPAAAEMCIIVRKVEEYTSMVWHVKSTLARKARPFYVSIQDTPKGISIRGINE